MWIYIYLKGPCVACIILVLRLQLWLQLALAQLWLQLSRDQTRRSGRHGTLYTKGPPAAAKSWGGVAVLHAFPEGITTAIGTYIQ